MERADHKASGAAHFGGLRVAVVVLPKDAVVFLVDADGAFDFPRRAVGLDGNVIQVVDFANAVAAKRQRVHAVADAGFAGVQNMLPAMHRIGIAVGHHHVRQRGAMQNRAQGAVVSIANVMQHEAAVRVNGEAKLPVLPRDGIAVHLEAHAFRLGDAERLQRLAQARLTGGVVAARLRRQRPIAVVLQMRDLAGGEIHMGDQPLHGTRIAVVRLVLAHEGDAAMGAMARRQAGMGVAAGRPRVYLHQIERLYAAPSHRRLPAWVFLGDADGSHYVGETDGRLPFDDAFDGNAARRKIDQRIEAAVWVIAGRIVVADQPQSAWGIRFIRRRCVLRRIHKRHRAESRALAHMGLH